MTRKTYLLAGIALILCLAVGVVLGRASVTSSWLTTYTKASSRNDSTSTHGDHNSEHDENDDAASHADHRNISNTTDHDDEHVHADDEHESVVILTPTAYANLQIDERAIERQEYWRTLRVPATVIEKPGHSRHALAAPIHGTVRRVMAVPGQAVEPNQELVELRVTDEALAQAQLDLLQDVTRLEVIRVELDRLQPLIEAGTVSGRQQRELTYEQQQLQAKRKLHEQELLVRGLDEPQVQKIISSKQLVRDFTVRLEANHHAHTASKETADISRTNIDEEGSLPDGPGYTVESVVAMPGTAVRRGDDLCHLAYHAELYVQGQVFENELEMINEAAHNNWRVTAEFGSKENIYRRENLRIEYIDNHVHAETQTFSFYVPILNEVVRDVVNDAGARFRTWRFKPGQRAHIRVPVEHWRDQIVLPRTAIVDEGPDVFVFRRHVHADESMEHDDHAVHDDHADHGDEPHVEDHHEEDHHEEDIEFERVAVRIIYRGLDTVVIAPSDELQLGDSIAQTAAYELNLALKKQSGSGGGHSHDHAH